MKIDHIDEIESLSRQALGDEQMAHSLTKAIVKAQEHWHDEAKDELLTKREFHQELHALSWRFFMLIIGAAALQTTLVYFQFGDIRNDLREVRRQLEHHP
jgi:hypothetical protein